MKKLSLSVLYILASGLLVASPVVADGTEPETEKVCYTQYGGGVICEEVEPEEVMIDTGVVENVVLAGVLFAAGYVVLLAANKVSLAK